MPRLDGFFVFLTGFSPLFQVAFHDAAGDFHAEGGHGRAIGQREDVGRLQCLVERVAIGLPHADFGRQARNPR